MPDVFVIAGPNGAGKTTAALQFLPQNLNVFEYVNADEIARGLNPLKPETANAAAARIALQRMHEHVEKSTDFAFETTLSGVGHAKFLRGCIESGYAVNLVYFWVLSADTAIERVRRRVRQGGHSIPEDDIKRRYARGLRNLINIYLPLCHSGIILDSTKKIEHGLVAEKEDGRLFVHDRASWDKILTEIANGR